MGKIMEKIINIACFFEFFISNFASAVLATYIYSMMYFLEIIIFWIANKVEEINSVGYLSSLFERNSQGGQDAFVPGKPKVRFCSAYENGKHSKRTHKQEKILREDVACREVEKKKISKKEDLDERKNVEFLVGEKRRPKENRKEKLKEEDIKRKEEHKKKDKRRKEELLKDLHDASSEKKRKTVKSLESSILENDDKKKRGKEENEKERHKKKDKKRKAELLEELQATRIEKKRKIFKSQECSMPANEDEFKIFKHENLGFESEANKSVGSNEDEKDVYKNESQSRRRKREYMHATNKDSWASESNKTQVEPSIVQTKKRVECNRDEAITDLVSQKQGFDEKDNLHHSIFVSSLPVKTRKKHLMKEFSQFGEVKSVKLQAVLIVETTMPRENAVLTKKINEAVSSCHAHIIFKDEQFANAALSCNITEFGGNHISADSAQPPSKNLRYSLL
eukprot:TRINITY_DN2323_c0_g1_i10.p1 TRINITY_DN2323_c0_g1~~TRINITY_DN2323_c0_g1_i10.p1  ORF type:complete len:452 (+),score=113.78 TRINITY_DN2323_c0_g1_i10:86-1441(+)